MASAGSGGGVMNIVPVGQMSGMGTTRTTTMAMAPARRLRRVSLEAGPLMALKQVQQWLLKDVQDVVLKQVQRSVLNLAAKRW